MSINLSDRLYLIAKEIKEGETVADIGTDHGFIPLYLVENGVSPKVIMTDVSRGSLDKAEANASEHALDGKALESRLGDGLDILEPGEVDVVVIAGMGGLLIRDILDWDVSKSRSFSRFILQPRSRSGDLRKWLCSNGFDIVKEYLVEEGSHIAEILVTEPASKCQENCDMGGFKAMAALDYPEDVISPFDESLVSRYRDKELEKQRFILEKMGSAGSIDENKVAYVKAKIERLEDLCERKNS